MTDTPQGPPGPDEPWPGHYQPGGTPPTQLSPADARMWAMLSHLGALLGALVTSGTLAWVVPLIVMLTKGRQSEYVRNQAVESLNFQITVLIAVAVSIPLLFVVVGFFLLLAVVVLAILFPIMASVAANRGDWYRYPLSIRLVR